MHTSNLARYMPYKAQTYIVGYTVYYYLALTNYNIRDIFI